MAGSHSGNFTATTNSLAEAGRTLHQALTTQPVQIKLLCLLISTNMLNVLQ